MPAIQKFFRWLWDHIDPLFALLLGLACSVLGLFNLAKIDILIPAILTTLTVIAFTLIRERSGREILQRRISNLTTKLESPVPDTVFATKTAETSVLQNAAQEVWVVQETGALLIETNKSQLVNLLKQGKHVRMLLSSNTDITARLTASRNANLDEQGISQRSAMSHFQIMDVVRQAKHQTEKLEVRFTPHVTDITCVIADPKHSDLSKRNGVVRLAGFQVPYDEKLDVHLDGRTSPRVFQHYSTQAQRMFESASKVVLLTGTPSSGKTSLFTRVLDGIEDKADLYFVLSPSVVEEGHRKAFEFITSISKRPTRFAERRNGDYEVAANVWDSVLSELENALSQHKIIILDEIGPLQLQDARFTTFINNVLNDNCATLFATVALDDRDVPFIYNIKHHYRTSVLYLERNRNEKTIEEYLFREMQASLRLARLLPYELLRGESK